MPFNGVPGPPSTMKIPTPSPRLIAGSSLLFLLKGVGFAHSQTAPAHSPTATEPVVELSPFEVRPDSDVGYQAVNTTNGSRLNTRLKDTPASISPFTPEFLSDIAATNLSDMLGYATNVELDTEDAV